MDAERICRQKKDRLLLLRHARQCPVRDDSCEATRHCRVMRELWVHIDACCAQDCEYPHCMSSRMVLCHFYGCADAECKVCAPVRAKKKS